MNTNLAAGGLASGLIVALILFIYSVTNRRLSKVEDKTMGIGNKLDNKTNREVCEDHRQHQTQINIATLERLARIETKVDVLIKNGKSING